VNVKCYQQLAPSSASQESSVTKRYHVEHNRAQRKSGTSKSRATAVTVPSKSEYESGTEGHHHQDVPISLKLSQVFESSPIGNVTPEEVSPKLHEPSWDLKQECYTPTESARSGPRFFIPIGSRQPSYFYATSNREERSPAHLSQQPKQGC
jgi:hypothetical protein